VADHERVTHQIFFSVRGQSGILAHADFGSHAVAYHGLDELELAKKSAANHKRVKQSNKNPRWPSAGVYPIASFFPVRFFQIGGPFLRYTEALWLALESSTLSTCPNDGRSSQLLHVTSDDCRSREAA
jgi:hypothetical protein